MVVPGQAYALHVVEVGESGSEQVLLVSMKSALQATCCEMFFWQEKQSENFESEKNSVIKSEKKINHMLCETKES